MRTVVNECFIRWRLSPVFLNAHLLCHLDKMYFDTLAVLLINFNDTGPLKEVLILIYAVKYNALCVYKAEGCKRKIML